MWLNPFTLFCFLHLTQTYPSSAPGPRVFSPSILRFFLFHYFKFLLFSLSNLYSEKQGHEWLNKGQLGWEDEHPARGKRSLVIPTGKRVRMFYKEHATKWLLALEEHIFFLFLPLSDSRVNTDYVLQSEIKGRCFYKQTCEVIKSFDNFSIL